MKVSFGFDGTLSRPDVQAYAKELIERGVEVIVTTSKSNMSNLYTYGEDGFCDGFTNW